MERISTALAAMLLLAPPAPASAKASIEGRWKNGQMEIVIAPCGEALCGTVTKASARQRAKAERGSGTDLIGARLINNIRPTGEATFRANVFVADRNINARGTIRQLGPNQLAVRGCVLAIICKSATWDRVSR